MSDAPTIVEQNASPPATPPAEPPQTPPQAQQPPAEPPAPPQGETPPQTPPEPPQEPKEGMWPEDWRERAARHVAGDDQKAYDKELRRLKIVQDPTILYAQYREMESRFSQGGLIKKPGENATESEIKAYRAAMDIPENTNDYVEAIQLPDGAVIGDDDRPVAEDFAKLGQEANLSRDQYNKVVNWYWQKQEEASAAMDEMDDRFRITSEREIKEELGGAFKRSMNSISSVSPHFDKSAFDDMLNARLPNGQLLGNSPDHIRGFISLAREVNPVASIVDDGDMTGKSVEAEIAEIEKLMRTDRRAYNKDVAKQQRYLQLLDARERIRGREQRA